MLKENKELYEFDKFRLDVSERFLLKSGKRVALTDRAFDTLCVLVRHNNRLIGKNELMTEVWADAIVEENNLDKNISALRQILGEKKGKQKFIETVRGHGYRFVAEVRRIEDFGFGISDSGFQSGNRNGDERLTKGGESTTEDQKLKTNARTENPKSQIPNPKSNVVALAAWRHETAADDETNTVEPTTNEIHKRLISDVTPSAVAPNIKSNKFRSAALVICALLVTAGIGYALYKFSNPTPMIFEAKKTTRITASGKVKNAAISPDGKYVTYAQEENGEQQSLWTQHITSESAVQISPPAAVQYHGLNISPDGNQLYYALAEGSLYQMPILGGAAKKIVDGLYIGNLKQFNIGIAPDGKQIAFVRRFEKEATTLFIINADGTNERTLAAFEQPIRLGSSVAWSPDGEVIACRAIIKGRQNILAVQVADGTSAPVLPQDWSTVQQIAWMPDSKSLLINTSGRGIHQIFYPSGEAYQLGIESKYSNELDLTSDGRFLATVEAEQVAHIWTMPSDDASRARQLTAGFEKFDGIKQINWIPDDKIVFDSYPNNKNSIWAVDANGGNSKQIAKGGEFGTALPDGQYLVYQRKPTVNNIGLWRVNVNDGREEQLTKGTDVGATFSPDGEWIVFTRYGERVGLWKVSLEGGEPTLILDENAICPAVSPDGKTVAFVWRQGGKPNRIALVSFDGGEIIIAFDVRLQTNPKSDKQNLQWTRDGRGIYFTALNDGVSNIWRQPIDGGQPEQVTNFTTGRIFNFAFSPDGSQIALSRGTFNSDVVLIENQN